MATKPTPKPKPFPAPVPTATDIAAAQHTAAAQFGNKLSELLDVPGEGAMPAPPYLTAIYAGHTHTFATFSDGQMGTLHVDNTKYPNVVRFNPLTREDWPADQQPGDTP